MDPLNQPLQATQAVTPLENLPVPPVQSPISVQTPVTNQTPVTPTYQQPVAQPVVPIAQVITSGTPINAIGTMQVPPPVQPQSSRWKKVVLVLTLLSLTSGGVYAMYVYKDTIKAHLPYFGDDVVFTESTSAPRFPIQRRASSQVSGTLSRLNHASRLRHWTQSAASCLAKASSPASAAGSRSESGIRAASRGVRCG